MKILKIIFGVILLVVPIGIHMIDVTDSTYMMTPLGGVNIRDGEFNIAFYSFKWLSEDGRIEYLTEVDDGVKLFSLDYYSDISLFDNDLSTAGLLTTLILVALIIYIVLMFLPGKVPSMIGDVLMIANTVMGLIAYITYTNEGVLEFVFDANFPIFAIVAGLFAILGIIITIKSEDK